VTGGGGLGDPLQREAIRTQRRSWLAEDPERVRRAYLAGEIDMLDVIRHYGVILDRTDMTVLPETSREFRSMLARRSVPYWN
jgi:N-methylhydantoinase B